MPPRKRPASAGAVRKRPAAAAKASSRKKSAGAKTEKWDGPTAKIAVAGAGWWSQGWHLPHLQSNPGSEITAIIEPCTHPRSTLNPDMKSTDELSKVYGVPVFCGIDEFLASAESKATDGIIICTSHSTHAAIGAAAIKAGLHILMEKPMTTDPEEAHELVKLATASSKIFMVNTSANYREQARIAQRLIVQEGQLGRIRHVSCSMASALNWLFDDPKNASWVTPSGKMTGNGFGWGQLCHTLSWVYMVTGLTPEKVFSTMGHSEKTGADLYDAGTIVCSCGATVVVQGFGTLVFKSYTESGKQIENRIFGSEGMLMFSGNDYDPKSGSLELQRHDGKHKSFPGFLFENYSAEGTGPESLKGFIAGCVGKPFFNGSDVNVNLKAVQTIDAMYRSVKSGNMEKVT